MMWRIITNDGYRQYPYEPSQEEYNRVGGIGDVLTIDDAHVWDKQAYEESINQAHNKLFETLYIERDYLSIGEIPLWEKDEEYESESLALQIWWVNTCKIVADYLENVTEETAQPIEAFINSLPKFDN